MPKRTTLVMVRKQCSSWEGKSYLLFSANDLWFVQVSRQSGVIALERQDDGW